MRRSDVCYRFIAALVVVTVHCTRSSTTFGGGVTKESAEGAATTGKDTRLGGEGRAGSNVGAGVSCGRAGSCDPSSTYCFFAMGGPMLMDGGMETTYACRPFPSACGSAPTCSCLKVDRGCQCTQRGGGFIVMCASP
jgi:hypothetical protein